MKFAVFPESSVNYHLNQNAKSSSGAGAAGKDDIDNILDMLNSPSMLQTGSALPLSPYKPTAASISFSPEIAKSGAQMFSQFGLATELFTPDRQEDVGRDENHSANVSPRKNADLLSSSWDENSVDLSSPPHGSQVVAPQHTGATKSHQTKVSSYNDSSSLSGFSNHSLTSSSQQSTKQSTASTNATASNSSNVSRSLTTSTASSGPSSSDAMKLIDEKIAAGKETQQRSRSAGLCNYVYLH